MQYFSNFVCSTIVCSTVDYSALFHAFQSFVSYTSKDQAAESRQFLFWMIGNQDPAPFTLLSGIPGTNGAGLNPACSHSWK